jgi:hypothetical protein
MGFRKQFHANVRDVRAVKSSKEEGGKSATPAAATAALTPSGSSSSSPVFDARRTHRMTRAFRRAYWNTTELMKLGKPECSAGDHRSGRLDMTGAEVEVVLR